MERAAQYPGRHRQPLPVAVNWPWMLRVEPRICWLTEISQVMDEPVLDTVDAAVMGPKSKRSCICAPVKTLLPCPRCASMNFSKAGESQATLLKCGAA